MKTCARFHSEIFRLDVTSHEDLRCWQFRLKDHWTESVVLSQQGETRDRQLRFKEPTFSFSFSDNMFNSNSELTLLEHMFNFEAVCRLVRRMYEGLLVFVDTPCERVCAEQLTIELLFKAASSKPKYDHHQYCSANPSKPVGSAGCSCKSISIWLEENEVPKNDEAQS